MRPPPVPLLRAAACALAVATASGVLAAGCSDDGSDPPSSTASGGGGSGGTTSGSQVGSEYWYEGDTYGNPYETHDSAEATLAQEVLALVNQERAAAGVAAVQADAEARQAAKAHCEDMLGRDFFAHVTPEGWDPDDRLQMTGAGGYNRVGENIAQGQTTAQQVMDAWMSSAGHRANILDGNYTHLGVGVAEGGGPTTWCQVFLTRP